MILVLFKGDSTVFADRSRGNTSDSGPVSGEKMNGWMTSFFKPSFC